MDNNRSSCQKSVVRDCRLELAQLLWFVKDIS